MKSQTAYFISDAHFGLPMPGEQGREKQFHLLATSKFVHAQELYILGDLFDFWVEYKSVIRADYFEVLCTLKTIVDHGVQVHYLAGNHDFALGSFLRDSLGITIHQGHLVRTIQGKKVHLFHGDGIIKQDLGYRILKPILRHPFNQYLYKKLLHPDLGVAFASFCSGSSRKYRDRRLNEFLISEYRKAAVALGESSKSDIIMLAHTHHAEMVHSQGKVYCNSGSWLINYNYVEMTNAQLTLWSHLPGQKPVQIKPGV